jgi:hypothetical protein
MENILNLIGEDKVMRHLAYSFKDVNTYNKLTSKEKLIFSKADFSRLKRYITNNVAQRVSLEEIHEIIETREKKGLFYSFDNGYWVGVSNLRGDAWTENFMTEEKCIKWLTTNEEIN